MNACNIMWLLNEVNFNTEIEILTGKSKSVDSIMISTNDFEFNISECGTCVLTYLDQPKSVEKDSDVWMLVKGWVKKYYQENF